MSADLMILPPSATEPKLLDRPDADLRALIDNAVKFAVGHAERPQVWVGMRRGPCGPVFCVRDNGIGIKDAYASKVFDLFEKLDPRSSGTGVGLAITKRVIEVHGGRIWVESEGEGRGSTFCFTLNEDKGERAT